MECAVMKVTHKQLIGTGLGLAAGLIIGRNLDVGLRTLKTIDAKMASSLPSSLQSIRWVAYGALSLGVASGLARCIELEAHSNPQSLKKEKAKLEKVDKPAVEQEFKPALRQVKNTNRVPTEQEKAAVRKVLESAGATAPKDNMNKEFLFWYELIQWVKEIGENTPQQVSEQANENPVATKANLSRTMAQRFVWNDSPFLQVYSCGKKTGLSGDWHKGRFMIATMGVKDWNTVLIKKSGVTLSIKDDPLAIDPNNLSTVIQEVLKGTWPKYPWKDGHNTNSLSNKGATGNDKPAIRGIRCFGITFYDNLQTWPNNDNNSNND